MAETGLNIDGTVYEVPSLDTFTLDECQVLYDYTSLTLEDFVPLADETEDDHLARIEKMMRHPGFKKTLLHVAYQRGNPKMPVGKVREQVAGANWLEPFATMGDDEPEETEVPLASTSEHDGSSPRSSLESASSPTSGSESSGTSSATGGDAPAVTPLSTGVSKLGTSPTSPPVTSAA